MTTGWAIVGIGRHPDNVMAPAIRAAKDTRLVSVMSRDKGRAQAFAAKHGAEQATDSLPELLSNPAVEVVYIASPNFLHRPQTIAAARAGKHVLCEKPMALKVSDCQAMIAACQKSGVKLGTAFHLRHHPAQQAARRMVQSGEAGQVAFAQAWLCRGTWGETAIAPRGGLEAWWDKPSEAGGGAIVASGVHAIDLLRFLLGQEVTEVSAFATEPTPQDPVDRTDSIILKFSGGAFGFALCSRLMPNAPADFAVYGSQACLKGLGTLRAPPPGELEVTTAKGSNRQSYGPVNMYVSEVESFNRHIRGSSEPVATGYDGLRTCQVHLGALKSARTGRAVKIEKA